MIHRIREFYYRLTVSTELNFDISLLDYKNVLYIYYNDPLGGGVLTETIVLYYILACSCANFLDERRPDL